MPDWEHLVRGHLGPRLARRERLVRELADHLEDVYREHLAHGRVPAEARARALDAAGDWLALRHRIEEEEGEMRARRVIGLAAAAVSAIVVGGLGWWAQRDVGPLRSAVTFGGCPCASPEQEARTGSETVGMRLPPEGVVARKVAVAPPSRPTPELLSLLESPIAAERVEAACQLAGAADLPNEAATRLWGLQREDPEEAVRLAATRAVALLQTSRVVAAEEPTGEPLKLVRITRPDYPRDAFAARVEGTVALLLLIDERGDVAHVEVRESIPSLDEAAVECAREWKFRAARYDGRPIPAAAVAPVAFRIY